VKTHPAQGNLLMLMMIGTEVRGSSMLLNKKRIRKSVNENIEND
jgi:hypothetical protein